MLSFAKPSANDCFGIKPARLRAFIAALVLESQTYGLLALLSRLARFRAGDVRHTVVIVAS